jgi:hypothetical protein
MAGPWLSSGYYWNNEEKCVEDKLAKWAQGYEIRPADFTSCHESGSVSFFSYRTP